MGRRTKRTSDREEIILKAIAGGNTQGTACKLAGIDHATFVRWKDASVEFAVKVARAEAEAEAPLIDSIRRAAMPRIRIKIKTKKVPLKSGKVMEIVERTEEEVYDWGASKWLLENINPAAWKNRQDIAIDGSIDLAGELSSIAQKLAERLGGVSASGPAAADAADDRAEDSISSLGSSEPLD